MPYPQITVLGTDWCGDCYRVRFFLEVKGIPYTWHNIDSDACAEQQVLKLNRGMRSVPTIIFEDGSVLVEPSNHELAKKLGI
jgi:mycoredoxin